MANELSLSADSAKKQFNAKFFCSSLPVVSVFQDCYLTLKDKNNKLIKDVSIIMGGGMPSHHHGLPTAPIIAWSEDKKVYKIKGLKYSMPGNWVLHFFINESVYTKTSKDFIFFEIVI